MNWTMKDNIESAPQMSTVDLKNCTKQIVMENHNKTVYECKNVTKKHCTTLGTINDAGEQIWTGNQDDCKDVTWEECNPVTKTVPLAVAKMSCDNYTVPYLGKL